MAKPYSQHLAERYDDRHFGGTSGALILRQEQEALGALLPERPGAILDVPCGTGVYAIDLRERGYRIVGADASVPMLEVMGRSMGAAPRVLADIHRLPFRGGSFDAATTLRLFSHFSQEEVARSLSELRRVIRPGGRVIFDTFRWSPRHWPLFRRLLKPDFISVIHPDKVEEMILSAGLTKAGARHLHLFSPIWQRKLPFHLLRFLIVFERLLPRRWLLRTIWACTRD